MPRHYDPYGKLIGPDQIKARLLSKQQQQTQSYPEGSLNHRRYLRFRVGIRTNLVEIHKIGTPSCRMSIYVILRDLFETLARFPLWSRSK